MDGGHERLRHVHLDELLRRGREEADEHHGLHQALLEEGHQAVDVGVDPGERLHDGVVPGGELGEEEDGDLQHLRADRVEEDLDEAVDDGGPGERGEDGLVGTGLPPEALDLEHQLLGLGRLLGRVEA